MTAPTTSAAGDQASPGVIDALNALLTGSRDGAKADREAAEAVERADIKALLTEHAAENDRHALEMEAEIRRLGGDPDDGGKLAAKARRLAQGIVAAVTGRDDSAVLSQVEAGLDQAERTYAQALRQPLGAETEALVRRQWQDMARQHNRIAELLRQDPGKAQAGR